MVEENSKARSCIFNVKYDLPQELDGFTIAEATAGNNQVPNNKTGNNSPAFLVTVMRLVYGKLFKLKFRQIAWFKVPIIIRNRARAPRSELGIVVGKVFKSNGVY